MGDVIDFRTGAKLLQQLCRDCEKRIPERGSHRCASCAHHVQTEQRVAGTSCAGCRCLLLPKSRIAFDPVSGAVYCSPWCWARNSGLTGGQGGA